MKVFSMGMWRWMFYATDRARLRKAMRLGGLQEVRFQFDFEGRKMLAMD